MMLVGDTGFEPVTSSMSGQNRCLGMRMSVASAACGGSLMVATVCAGWPTASRLTSVGSTAAPASCRSRASDRAHRRIARRWRCPREPSREIWPRWPAAAVGPFALWTSRSPTSNQVCQTGHYPNRRRRGCSPETIQSNIRGTDSYCTTEASEGPRATVDYARPS